MTTIDSADNTANKSTTTIDVADNTTTKKSMTTANIADSTTTTSATSTTETQSAITQGSLITIWVLLEGKSSATKLFVDSNEFLSQNPDLDDFKNLLIKRFKNLSHVEPVDLEIYDFKDISQTLLSDTSLRTLNTSADSPLFVSNSWAMLRDAATKKFEHLITSDFYFVVQDDTAEEIDNEFQFNNLMSRTPRNNFDECILNLKVQIKGKKSYGDWKIKEVFED
ncbi:9511_t:CDS:2, partial [Ambispora leptoticha]